MGMQITSAQLFNLNKGSYMKYISARIKPAKVYHGYTDDRQLIVDDVPSDGFVEKVIKIDRILSITAKYIFIETPHDTVQTWEYEGGFESMKKKMSSAGLLVD